MSLFNDNLKNIRMRNVAILLIVSYLIIFCLSRFGVSIDEIWIYIVVICYFIVKLKDYSSSFRDDLSSVFSVVDLRYILLVVVLNIFFSYGMLYLADAIINNFPYLSFITNFSLASKSLSGPVPILGSFISTVIIASISEELIFRGVFLSRLRLIVPTVFAILISSLLFGALHSYGSILSAFVFGICMAILYIKTDNICVPIFAHFLNNLFAEIIRVADVNNLLFTDFGVMALVSILALISAIFLFTSILKELNKVKYKGI